MKLYIGSYDQWMEEIRHEIYVTEGYVFEELPQWDWWKCYNNGWTPSRSIHAFFGYKYVQEND